MTDKPSAIATYAFRRRRARKRKQAPPIPQRIVSPKPPKPPAGPVIDDAVVSPRRPSAQAAAITGPRIVTAKPKRGRFGPVQDLTPEEHQRRGDAAEALFREIVRRAQQAMAGRKPPERYWRSYGNDPLPPGAEATVRRVPKLAHAHQVRPVREGPLVRRDALRATRHAAAGDHQAHAPRWLWRPGW